MDRPAPRPQGLIRWLLMGGMLLLPAAAWGQELIYSLPGGASADTITTPNAFAAPAGVFYAGLSVHTEPEANDALDGLAVIGVGAGTVESAVEFRLIVSDLSELSGGFASVKWHFHNETAKTPALAVGVEDPTASASQSATYYLAATKTFWDTSARSAFLMRTTVSAGFGDGRFRRRPFGAVSTSLDPFSKAIVEYDGRGINAGLSVSESIAPRVAAVAVLAREGVDRPGQGAWTMSVAVAWEAR